LYDFQETAMTMTGKAGRLAVILAMVGGSVAIAQQTAVPEEVALNAQVTVPGFNMQVNVPVNVSYQAKDDLFAGAEKFAQGASDVTEINLDPNTMGMVGKSHGRDGEMARKMKTMSIHTYKYDKPGMYRMEDVEAYRKKLEDGSWNCSVHTRNKNGSTDICSRTASDHETNEMVILTAEPQKLTFIHMKGKMSLDELNDMNGNGDDVRPHLPKPPKMKITPPEAPAAPAPPAQ
jgi:Domain of unknown function (DUF4252)